jgi:hypothetical protein
LTQGAAAVLERVELDQVELFHREATRDSQELPLLLGLLAQYQQLLALVAEEVAAGGMLMGEQAVQGILAAAAEDQAELGSSLVNQRAPLAQVALAAAAMSSSSQCKENQ